MQLSQQALLGLFVASFTAGLLLALFSDFLYTIRLWLMPSGRRYTVPSIQKRLAKRAQKGSNRKSRRESPLILFLSDVLLCIVGAITLILVLYWFNNGAFRLEAPLCMSVGFYLWYRIASKGVRIILQWCLFAVETVFYTLSLPLQHLFVWAVRTHKKNVQKRRVIRFAKERKVYTQKQLQNVDRMTEMLLPIELKIRKKKGDSNARKSKKTV